MAQTLAFETALRHALKHLYDPVFLRHSPLVKLFGLEDSPNVAEALREVLQTGIEALAPRADSPSALRSQRYHQLLSYRYIQQFTQLDAAHHMGLSSRHLRREQTAAIQALAERLRLRFGLPDHPPLPAKSAAPSPPARKSKRGMEREMLWLGDSLADQSADVEIVLNEALQLAQIYARSHAVTLNMVVAEDLPAVAVAPTVLKQIVLNLLTTAIRSVHGGRVSLAVQAERGCVVVQVGAYCIRPEAYCDTPRSIRPGVYCDTPKGVCDTPLPGQAEAAQRLAWDEAEVDMSSRLAELFKGSLAVEARGGALTATVTLPAAQENVVLAIEDNVDTLQLWERYLEGTHFRLVGVREPQQAVPLAIKLQPSLIVLDVMMPGVDGWELLGQLRHHPATAPIPVIVCTVLPQKDLALSLGASDFIRKPVTRRAFQGALERQIGAVAPA